MVSLIKCGLEESHYLVLIKFTKDVFQIYIASDDNAKKFLNVCCEWPIFLLLKN